MVWCWRWTRVRVLCRSSVVSRHDHRQTRHRWCTRGTCSSSTTRLKFVSHESSFTVVAVMFTSLLFISNTKHWALTTRRKMTPFWLKSYKKFIHIYYLTTVPSKTKHQLKKCLEVVLERNYINNGHDQNGHKSDQNGHSESPKWLKPKKATSKVRWIMYLVPEQMLSLSTLTLLLV